MADNGMGVDTVVQDYLARTVGPTDAAYQTDRRLYLKNDGTLAEEGDPDAAFLLAPEGGTIPQSVADALGLKAPKKKKSAADDAPAADAPPAGGITVTNDDSAVAQAQAAAKAAQDAEAEPAAKAAA